MRNKNVGFLIMGLAVIMAVIVWLFNNLVKNNLSLSCSMGPECSMYSGLNIQTWVSIVIVGVIFLIGLFFVFAKEKEKIVTRTIKEKRKEIDISKLDRQEKQVVKIIQQENGAIFQASLMEKLGIGKVGLTRLLDKLEAKQIIERKRRGMNNIVVLK